jgi:hypothetical protein
MNQCQCNVQQPRTSLVQFSSVQFSCETTRRVSELKLSKAFTSVPLLHEPDLRQRIRWHNELAVGIIAGGAESAAHERAQQHCQRGSRAATASGITVR